VNNWKISAKYQTKSPTGHVGLKNLGCTCYMNSLMQQLFMVKGFRKNIFEVEDPKLSELKEEDNPLL